MKLRLWHSFQGRSVLAVIGVALLVWLTWTMYVYWDARRENSAIFDPELESGARLALSILPRVKSEQVVAGGYQLPKGPDVPFGIGLQLWTLDGRLLMRSSSAPAQPLNPSFEVGFSSHVINGERWRGYSLTDAAGEVQVQLAERLPERDDIARIETTKLLTMMAVALVPVTISLVAMILWTALPLSRLRHQLDYRRPNDHAALSTAGLPNEVLPLVQSFNQMLLRVEEARLAQQRFVAGAAHELRTPLAALRVQAQVAQRSKHDDEREAALMRLQSGIDRSARMVDQLLELARLDGDQEARERETISLPVLAQEVMESCGPLAARRQISVKLHITDATLSGNLALLYIALRNLLDNALRYSPSGGLVTLGADVTGDSWAFYVQDAGPGLNAAQRKQVIQPFVRMHEGEEIGSGLGLAIVQRVAMALGAELSLEDAAPAPGLRAVLRHPARQSHV